MSRQRKSTQQVETVASLLTAREYQSRLQG